jgi:hypothetical protein
VLAAERGAVVAGLLKPGGRLFIRDGHPMLWTLDESADPAWPRYHYFETAEPLESVQTGTYVDSEKTISNSTTHSWNHSLGEIITALLENGMGADGVHRARQCAVERDPRPDDARQGDRRMAHDPGSAPTGGEPHHPGGKALTFDTGARKPVPQRHGTHPASSTSWAPCSSPTETALAWSSTPASASRSSTGTALGCAERRRDVVVVPVEQSALRRGCFSRSRRSLHPHEATRIDA